ncbi:Srl4p Ecym_5606 [Eremothecium cymbalariae DBVPG|uniref:Uncharacterized protein n=1 Tax=Eremothecium cymbalariae (strain CBS 270.75 / DBVPG 7215 / KCTC 17166 / NRRL Y-17582) TaxID=931890 RepID=I6NE50_ERECY|nr:hypothetical protein Ecym_5606 [Eremothecium cymbalariae DBVPG\
MEGYINRLVRKVYKYASILNDVIGPGKVLESYTDTVLILGGSSNMFGIELCRTLILNEGIQVVNLDTVDRQELMFGSCQSSCCSFGRNPNLLSVLEENNHKHQLQEKRTKYHFVKCSTITNKKDVLDGLNRVLDGRFGISVFINNVNEGLFEFMQGSTDPMLSHGPVDIMNKSLLQGSQKIFQDVLNSNLINVMLSVKFFLNEIVPQTMNILQEQNKPPGFYIVNITNTLSLHAPAFAGYYAASKAGLNQFHESLTSELGYYNKRRIKTLLIFLPFLSTHTMSNIPWVEYAAMLVRDLKLGRSGELTLSVVPGKFQCRHILSMSYPIKFWRAYEPWWWEKQLIAIAHGYPHTVNNVWPFRRTSELLAS